MNKCYQLQTSLANDMVQQKHKFAPQNSITSEKLKFQPIIAQTGTHTYNAAQVIAEYLKLLADENSNM